MAASLRRRASSSAAFRLAWLLECLTNVARQFRYSKGLATLHWAIALGTVGCFVTVKQQQATKVPAEKGMWMWRHKSLGALLAILVPIRIGGTFLRAHSARVHSRPLTPARRLSAPVALTSRRPPSVSTNMLESIGAKVSHAGLYFIMVFMPVSGITMGYFGGKGIPFFFTKIEGKSAEEKTPEDGALAKQAFINHKRVGQVLPYWVGIHAGAVGYHAAFKGTNLLKRMSPF